MTTITASASTFLPGGKLSAAISQPAPTSSRIRPELTLSKLAFDEGKAGLAEGEFDQESRVRKSENI